MAVAEARAVWQRTANRCFVQEDAKRAPKLACCQSSSSSSSKQVDGVPVNEAGMPDEPAMGFTPCNRNPPYSSLPPDTRWWLQLQLQPNYGYQKGLTHEQLNALEAEMENLRAEMENSASKVGQEAEVLYNENSPEENLKLMDMEAIECLPWIASENNGPWWRTTDRDDLASLVAHKSLDYVENCDLPPPKKIHVKRYSVEYPKSFNCSGPVPENPHEFERVSSVESDNSKAELLEALRHSQTRAREAEKVAKRACEEKEHIVKLFLRQASQLFAYKQWLQLLQLEKLYHQVKDGEQPVSILFPAALPWMPRKGRKQPKNFQKSGRNKRGRHGKPSNSVSKYAVAFALGLSLVGAGLLLGWTVGWMLPL